MVSTNHPALRRLRALLRSPAAVALLDGARILPATGGHPTLRVEGAFQKERLQDRYADELREAFGGPVVVDVAPRDPAPKPRPMPEFALRMVRAFVEGGPAAAPVVLVHGPPDSGKSTMLNLARAMGTNRVFEVDVARLSRSGFVPRKPLVVVDRVEALTGKVVAQRALCHLMDAVQTRGDRVLLALEGHPAHAVGICEMLRNRLLGAVLVPLEARHPVRTPTGPLVAMKDVAARLFGVERALMDGATKRRTVVEARRAVIAAARRGGLAEAEIAAAFGLRSVRAVREACRWADTAEAKDHRFAAFVHEVGRVLPKQ